MGSCNWTTSSRANWETDIYLRLSAVGQKGFEAFFQDMWEAGRDAAEEEVRAAQRAKSHSPSRQYTKPYVGTASVQ